MGSERAQGFTLCREVAERDSVSGLMGLVSAARLVAVVVDVDGLCVFEGSEDEDEDDDEVDGARAGMLSVSVVGLDLNWKNEVIVKLW